MIDQRFTFAGWKDAGFSGFVPLLSPAVGQAPGRPGVYAVLRTSTSEPTFEPSSGGWFKGKDPNVPASTLDANWVPGAETVYIGKASTSLAQRLKAYQSFGRGKPVAHWGGRLIRQLADRNELLACWATVSDDVR